jgi:DNA-binding XRE family transcriptional regulator
MLENGETTMAMSAERKAELESKGVIFTTTQEFLGLNDAEMRLIDLRNRLSRAVKERREASGLTQRDLAKRLGISQPRIPAMESGGSTSLETLFTAFLTVGGTPKELGTVVASMGTRLIRPRRTKAQKIVAVGSSATITRAPVRPTPRPNARGTTRGTSR